MQIEIEIEDELLDRAMAQAPAGTSLNALVEMALEVFIQVREAQISLDQADPAS